MATRFKLTADATAPAVSPALQAYGHSAPATVRSKLLTSDSSALATVAYTPDGADHLVAGDSLHRQFVSDGMAAGIAFTNADAISFAVQCLEANAGNNLNIQLFVSIVSSDGGTVRRTLRTKVEEATELATSLTNRHLSTTQDGATYTTVDGDRLVVEFSVEGTPVGAGGVQGHNASLRWGGNGAGGDLGANDTDTGTTLNPWIEFAPTITFPAFTPAVNAFRFYYPGSESGSTPIAAQDTDITLNANGNYRFHLRFRVQEGGGGAGAATDDYQLQVSKNAGAYANVAAASTNVKSFDGPELTDGGATTNRATNGITDGTGSFVAGEVEDVNGSIEDLQITASNFTELLYACEVVGADVANGDTLDFRITLNGGTPGMTNSVVPTITVSKPSTADYSLLTGDGVAPVGVDVTTASVTPSSNKQIIIVIANRRNPDADAVTSIAGNGLTWTQQATQLMAGEAGDHRISIWKAKGTASAGTIVITFPNIQERVTYAVIEFTHNDGSIVQSATNDQTGTVAPSVTLAAFANADNDTFAAWHTVEGTGQTFSRETTYDQVSYLNNANTVTLNTGYVRGNDTNPTGVLAASHNVAGIALEIAAVASTNPPFRLSLLGVGR